MGDEGGGGRGGSTKEMGGGEEGPFSVSPIPRRRAQAGDRWCLNGWQAAGARGGVELISTGIGMTKADMIPKFLVLVLIIVGVVGVLGVVRPAPSPAWKSVISSFHHLRCWS